MQRSLTSVFALFIVGCTAAPSLAGNDFLSFPMPIPIYGTPPDKVNHWIRIVWQGPMNHPIVPVYFIAANETAPKYSVTSYVKLEKREYSALSEFIHSFSCLTASVSDKPPYPKSIGIDEFDVGKVRRICVLPPVEGCKYLFGLAKLPIIDWSQKDTWPIAQFEYELGCPEPLTPAHDANGHSD